MWIELDLIGDGSYSNDQLLPFITNPGLLPFGHPVAKDLLPFHSPLPFTGITEGQECKRLHLGLHSFLVSVSRCLLFAHSNYLLTEFLSRHK